MVAAVALGGMIGDQLLYFLGLRFGPTLLQRFAGHQRKFAVLSGLSSDVPAVCDWHPLYVRFSHHWADTDWRESFTTENFPAAEHSRAIARALIFTTLGYAGGEVIGPWLHNLDQHLKHWAWLIPVVAVVIGVRLWLKHRESGGMKSEFGLPSPALSHREREKGIYPSGLNCGFASIKPPSTINDCPVV